MVGWRLRAWRDAGKSQHLSSCSSSPAAVGVWGSLRVFSTINLLRSLGTRPCFAEGCEGGCRFAALARQTCCVRWAQGPRTLGARTLAEERLELSSFKPLLGSTPNLLRSLGTRPCFAEGCYGGFRIAVLARQTCCVRWAQGPRTLGARSLFGTAWVRIDLDV
jgi:hypothetical protein